MLKRLRIVGSLVMGLALSACLTVSSTVAYGADLLPSLSYEVVTPSLDKRSTFDLNVGNVNSFADNPCGVLQRSGCVDLATIAFTMGNSIASPGYGLQRHFDVMRH